MRGTRFRRLVVCSALLAGIQVERTMADCTITVTPVHFGSYDVFSPHPVDSTGTIGFHCDTPTDVSIFLDRGDAWSFGKRRMLSGWDELFYNLYVDPAMSTIWGDGTEGTSHYYGKSLPDKSEVEVSIFGRIPPGQDVSAGSYANKVTAIINF